MATSSLNPSRRRSPANGRAKRAALQRQAEALGIGQRWPRAGARAKRSLKPRAAGLLDVRARVVDEVHVVDAARAGGHAREAGQAAVDVALDLGARRAVVLEHLLHQVDAAARAVALVAEQHVGRAGGGAEAAVHAAAQDLVDLRDARVLAAAWRVKLVCMAALVLSLRNCVHAAGIEDAGRIEGGLELAREPLQARLQRLEHLDRGAHLRLGADQRGMPAVRGDDAADVGGAGVGRRQHLGPDEPARPVVERAALHVGRDGGDHLRARRRRGRDAPERRIAALQHRELAQLAPEGKRILAVELVDLAVGLEVLLQPAACGRRPTWRSSRAAARSRPGPARAGPRARAGRPGRAAGARRPTPRRACAMAVAQHLDGDLVRQAEQDQRCRCPPARAATLNVTSLMTASVPQLPARPRHRS